MISSMKRSLSVAVVLLAVSALAPAARAVPVRLLTQNNELVTFDSGSPGTASLPEPITGLGTFTLVGMDVRTTVQTLSPANPGVGTLWALGVDGVYTRLFVINPATAAATPVGPVLTGIDGSGSGPNGWFFGHNPGTDRFRLMNFVNNYELDPNSMTFVKQADLAGFPNPNGSAFETASYGQSPKIFFVDQDVPSDRLFSSADIAGGSYAPVGFTGLDFSIGSGLDIFGETTLFAADVGGITLYSINRSTGAATPIGPIVGAPSVRAIAIAPPSFPGKLPVKLTVKGKKRIETSAASVKIRGTAKSQAGIKRVEYRVGKAKKAKKAKGKAKWNAKVRVKRGLNVITFRAVGTNDVLSKPKKVRVRRN